MKNIETAPKAGPAPRSEISNPKLDISGPASSPRPPASLILVALLLLLALGFRLVWLNSPLERTHHWNEGHFASSTLNFPRYGWLDQRNDLGPDRSFSPLVPLLLYPAARAAGWQPWGFRLPLALFGVAALGVFYPLLRRRWGLPPGAALAALSAAASAPGIVYYARNIQLDGVATTLLLTALWLVSSKKRPVRLWGWAAWAACVAAKTPFAVAAPALLLARVAARPGDWRRLRIWLAAGVGLGLGLGPIALWLVRGGVADPGASGDFLLRLKEWSWRDVGHALRETPGYFVRDFGWPGLALALLGAAGLIGSGRWRMRRIAAPLALGLFWAVFIFTHPTAYWNNRYYIYPGLFALSALAGWGCWFLAARLPARLSLPALAGLCLTLLCVNGKLYIENYGRVLLKGPALLAAAQGEDPFAAVKALNAAGSRFPRPILVDDPATMFYAGGDPARVHCAHGSVTQAFDPARFSAVVLDVFEEDRRAEAKLLEKLKAAGWHEIAPRIWSAP